MPNRDDALATHELPRRDMALSDAARIMRRAMKDKSYRGTSLGLEVGHFMRYLKNEYGATTETLRDYEAILAKLALDHGDLELSAFEPPEGTHASTSVHREPLG